VSNLRVNLSIEGQPEKNQHGYDRRETLATLIVDVPDGDAWHVYEWVVHRLAGQWSFVVAPVAPGGES